MDYVETHARVRTLPPLFPIVLYNLRTALIYWGRIK
jgi:hypothetical protein